MSDATIGDEQPTDGSPPPNTHTARHRRRASTELEGRKRVVYALAAAAIVVVLITTWFDRDPGDGIVAVGYPIVAVLAAVLAIATWRRTVPLPVVEMTAYTLMAVVVMGRLTWHLHLAGTIDEHLLILVGAHYWAVGLMILAGFAVFGLRVGTWAGVAIIGTSIVLVVTGAGPQLVGAGGSSVALVYLLRVHLFLMTLLALSSAVATARAHLHRSLAREDLLRELATTDHLTGLANRRAATEALDTQIESAQRYDRDLAVTLMDLDHFKVVNDTHGHARGDQVLRDVAQVLVARARTVDMVARWGGEEFLIIAPETGAAGAARMAERMRTDLAAGQPGGLDVTATFGVAELRAGDDLRLLLQRADRALYRGKDAGRDRVVGPEDPIDGPDTSPATTDTTTQGSAQA